MSKFQVGDDLVIDLQHRLVQQHGVEIKLPELSYRLLLTLVENAPHIVSHDKLVAAVWQDRVVSDENLKKRVSRLRQALSDEADSPSYIVAERGMGYRCIAPVMLITDAQINASITPQPVEPVTSSKRIIKPILLFSLVVLVAIGVMLTIVDYGQKSRPAVNVGDFTANDYVNKATQYYYRFKANDNDTAVMLYKKAIDRDPNFGPAYGGLANAYAQGYYQFGKDERWLQRSVDFAKRAIEIEPEQPWGYKSLGLALSLNGRYDGSLAAYSKASKLAPNWAGPLANSALINLEKGQLVLAYQKLIKSVKMDFKDPIPYAFLAFCYRELGMPDHAKKAFDKSLSLKPDYLLAQHNYAEFLLFTEDYKAAQTLLTTTREKAPNNQLNHWINAQLHLQKGDLILAKTSFEQMTKRGGRYQLPAKINLAVINKDELELVQLAQQVARKIQAGNQWAELIYSKGLILLAQHNTTAAITAFEQGIKAGMNHAYRFKNHPLMLNTPVAPEFKKLIILLESKNKQQRQAVIKLEHLIDSVL